MSSIGMWMPKQKSGKNWILEITLVERGEEYTVTRRFRVRQDASDFIAEQRRIEGTHIVVERGYKVVRTKISKI